MCCRFNLDLESASPAILNGMDALNEKEIFPKFGDIFPEDLAMVFANNRKLEVKPFAMSWGFHTFGDRPIINARSETAAEKRYFAESMKSHRCAIPATGYYEWQRTETAKRKYDIRARNGKMFYLAGLYRTENCGIVFTVLTKGPDESVAFIHDRMPVLLPEEAMGDWLNLRYDANDVLKNAGIELIGKAC